MYLVFCLGYSYLALLSFEAVRVHVGFIKSRWSMFSLVFCIKPWNYCFLHSVVLFPVVFALHWQRVSASVRSKRAAPVWWLLSVLFIDALERVKGFFLSICQKLSVKWTRNSFSSALHRQVLFFLLGLSFCCISYFHQPIKVNISWRISRESQPVSVVYSKQREKQQQNQWQLWNRQEH